jgi:hypothetical protein
MYNSYAFKNKLEKSVYEYLKTLDRFLVPAGNLESIIKEIESELRKLSSEFPRCKPISYDWSNYDDEKKDLTLYLNGGSICSIKGSF